LAAAEKDLIIRPFHFHKGRSLFFLFSDFVFSLSTVFHVNSSGAASYQYHQPEINSPGGFWTGRLN
jgi:hypothetical protein